MEQSDVVTAEPSGGEFPPTTFTIDTLIQLEAEFVGIDRAIDALQRGTYGRCEVCDVAISPARLRSDPVLVRCDAHIVRETPALFIGEQDGPTVGATATTSAPTRTTLTNPSVPTLP